LHGIERVSRRIDMDISKRNGPAGKADRAKETIEPWVTLAKRSPPSLVPGLIVGRKMRHHSSHGHA
jgi:hypothetical protein